MIMFSHSTSPTIAMQSNAWASHSLKPPTVTRILFLLKYRFHFPSLPPPLDYLYLSLLIPLLNSCLYSASLTHSCLHQQTFLCIYFVSTSMSDLSEGIAALHLGAADPPRRLSQQTQNITNNQNINSLVVRPLHSSQNTNHLRSFLANFWHIDLLQDIVIQDDGNLLVRFDTPHRMLQVLDGGPWVFRGWFIAIDKWSNLNTPEFLSRVNLWIKILNVPSAYRQPAILEEIGSIIGHPIKTKIKQPTRSSSGEAWVRVSMPVHSKLKFVTSMYFGNDPNPTFMQFEFLKLKHFCKTCGSILHLQLACDINTTEAQREGFNNDQQVPRGTDSVTENSNPRVVPSLNQTFPINANRQSSLIATQNQPQTLPRMNPLLAATSRIIVDHTRGLSNFDLLVHAAGTRHQNGPTGTLQDMLLPLCNINDNVEATCPLHGYIHPPNLVSSPPQNTTTTFAPYRAGYVNISPSNSSSYFSSPSVSTTSSIQLLRSIRQSAEAAFESTLQQFQMQSNNINNSGAMETPISPRIQTILQSIINNNPVPTSPPVPASNVPPVLIISEPMSPTPVIPPLATHTTPTILAAPNPTDQQPVIPTIQEPISSESTDHHSVSGDKDSLQTSDSPAPIRYSRKRKAPTSESSSEEPSPRRRRLNSADLNYDADSSATSKSSTGEVGTPKPPANK